METQFSFGKYLEQIVVDIKNDVYLLSRSSGKHRQDRLMHLSERVDRLEEHVGMINNTYALQVNAVPLPVANGTEEDINFDEVIDVPGTQMPPQPAPITPAPEQPIPEQPVPGIEPTNRTFTPEELSMYNGRGGNPAYVAVDGTVYDVTNSSVWAAATHFGLTAGSDWTSEYQSCHAGENPLGTMPVIGVLVEP